MVDTNVIVLPMDDKTVHEKTLGHLDEKVKMDMGRRKQGLVLYSSHVYEDEAINGYKQ